MHWRLVRPSFEPSLRRGDNRRCLLLIHMLLVWNFGRGHWSLTDRISSKETLRKCGLDKNNEQGPCVTRGRLISLTKRTEMRVGGGPVWRSNYKDFVTEGVQLKTEVCKTCSQTYTEVRTVGWNKGVPQRYVGDTRSVLTWRRFSTCR